MKSPSAVLCTDMKTRNPQLDVLRGIAVIAVVGHHHAYYPLWFRVGRFGVDLFFVLSGFLISGLLFAEYKSTNAINLGMSKLVEIHLLAIRDKYFQAVKKSRPIPTVRPAERALEA